MTTIMYSLIYEALKKQLTSPWKSGSQSIRSRMCNNFLKSFTQSILLSLWILCVDNSIMLIFSPLKSLFSSCRTFEHSAQQREAVHAAQRLLCRSCGPASPRQSAESSPSVHQYGTAVNVWPTLRQGHQQRIRKVMAGARDNFAHLSQQRTLHHVRGGMRLTYHVQHVINYAGILELEYSVHFFPALTLHIACDMQSFQITQDANLPIFCLYTRFEKLFLKNENFTFFYRGAQLKSRAFKLDLVHPNDATLYSSSEKDAKMLNVAADRDIKNSIISAFLKHSPSTMSKRRCCLHIVI